MATQSEIGSPPTGMARIAMLTGWLLAAGFCVWLEGTRILQLAATPAGILGWFAAWNIDTTLPALVLLALPLTILISLLAAWWPARKAVNLNVVEAIGYE